MVKTPSSLQKVDMTRTSRWSMLLCVSALNRFNPLRWLYIASAAYLLVVTGVWCIAAPSQFSIQSWQTDQGLPQNSVTAVFQAKDGYIWFGTYNGLVRFDGVRFTVFDSVNSPGLKNSRVTSLYQADDEIIWIGHETGDVSTLSEGKFATVKLPDAWPKTEIVAFGQDQRRDVWALNISGLLIRLRDQQLLNPPSTSDLVTVARPSLSKQLDGPLRIIFRGAVAEINDRKLVPFVFDPTNAMSYTEQIGTGRDGAIWIIGDQLIRKWKEDTFAQSLGAYPWGQAFITAVMETSSGLLVVGTLENGLFVLGPDGLVEHVNRTSGLPHDWVRCVTEDHENNLWVGTSGGLCVLRAAKATMHNPPDAWQGREVLSVTQGRDGCLWIGTEGAGLYQFHNGTWTNFGTGSGLNNKFIWSVMEDSTGKLWVGTWGEGLFVREGNRFIQAPGFEPFRVQVTALLEGRDREIWAGTGAGLLCYKAGQVTSFGREQGVSALDIRCIAQAPDGTVWFGTTGGGLGRLRKKEITMFTRADGLPSDFLLSLYLDPQGTLWIGTLDHGLSRLRDGIFANIDSAQGLANDAIGHIAEGPTGWLWFSSQAGIFRVNKKMLNDFADGKLSSVESLSYGKSQGLSTLACDAGFQPSGTWTADGHLWIPTAKGLAEINPTQVRKNISPPPVHLESASVGGKEIRLNEFEFSSKGFNGEHNLRLLGVPAGNQRFSLQFTALSYIAPEKVHFRYRLAPLDSEWVETSKRYADYSYVPPGHYVFTVLACNNDGLWNQVGAQLRIVVQPHYWQTAWFQTGTALVLVSGIGLAVFKLTRQRERRKLERIKREAALERERTRIAQDLHDDLGASLTRMTILSNNAREESHLQPQLRSTLDEIYGTAREVTRIMDEIVWAVNPRHDSLESLINYLGRFSQNFLTSAGIRCRLDLPFDVPKLPLHTDLRHNIFLAFKEAINNVVRHSRANEVTISLTLDGTQLKLIVADNGSGFNLPPELVDGKGLDEAKRPAHGNGLANLHRRLRELHGRCRISSTPGKGTQIELVTDIRNHSKHYKP
jgi:ligand-binding sensor domain-containing protein/anti-sigma regulatory factor (Ser/Thr protein kinase)